MSTPVHPVATPVSSTALSGRPYSSRCATVLHCDTRALLHICTPWKDAAYCYRCSVVCVSVCLLVTATKTDGPIDVPAGMWTQLRPGNHVSRGGRILPPTREEALLGMSGLSRGRYSLLHSVGGRGDAACRCADVRFQQVLYCSNLFARCQHRIP